MYDRYTASKPILCSYSCRRYARLASCQKTWKDENFPCWGFLYHRNWRSHADVQIWLRLSTVSVTARGEHDGQWSDVWSLSSEAVRSVMCGVEWEVRGIMSPSTLRSMCSWSDGRACHAEFPEPDGQLDITASHPTRQQAAFLSLVRTFFSSAGPFLFHPILSLNFFLFTFLCSFYSLFRFLPYSCFNHFLPFFLLSVICTSFNYLHIHQLSLAIILTSRTASPTSLQWWHIPIYMLTARVFSSREVF